MFSRASTCLSLTAIALLLAACKPSDAEPEPEPLGPADPVEVSDGARAIAEQLCASTFDCACTNTEAYASEAACVAEVESNLQSQIDMLTAAGGEWNAQCAGELVRSFEVWECLGPRAAQQVLNFNPRTCTTLSGAQQAGSECFSNNGVVDECQAGLTCLSGECFSIPSVPVPEGELCEYGWETLPCVSGSYCDYDPDVQTSICQAVPSLGDACDPAEQYLCGPDSNDLICDNITNTCIAAPAAGEPCFDGFLCGPGTYCDGGQDFTCQARFELGDGCGADAVCPVDASCIGNICTADPPAVCGALYWF